MRLYKTYHFEGIAGTYPAEPPDVLTVLFEFDTEQEMNESGLLQDKRRTTCFASDGKYYVGGHFETNLTRCDLCDCFDHDSGSCIMPSPDLAYACPLQAEKVGDEK
ncbi:hypothetical protein FACS1894217_05150 [Clostridia bacterium]|nr:hypothetical protein FACS1894217_05150 [Clostridia bacterium]